MWDELHTCVDAIKSTMAATLCGLSNNHLMRMIAPDFMMGVERCENYVNVHLTREV